MPKKARSTKKNPAPAVAGLIVPVDITALCVGIKDQEDKKGTSTFAGATTSFLNQTGKYDAFLGSNVVRPLTDAPLHQLKKGIHLHWALPEALTRGDYIADTGETTFPAVPNRWLLSRIHITNGTATRKTWIIESDFLHDTSGIIPPYAVVTLPVRTINDKEQNYRYTGRSMEFVKDWKEPPDPEKFKDLTGQELCAVASGDTAFAAFYPNCRNVFGFYDDVTDLVIPTGKTANLCYQVTGWYGKEENDPLYGGKTLEQIQDGLGWTFKDSSASPSYSFYTGLTQAISWSPDISYIVDNPDNRPIAATVTAGNNPPETFSAYFKDRLHPEQPFFEQLLNAFQMGLLPAFQEPQPDQLSQMEEMIHQKQFGAGNAGLIYLIVQKSDEKNINDPYDGTTATDLPLSLEIALNGLNVCQQEYDFYLDYVDGFNGQLFSYWYRLMKAADDILKNELDSIIQAQIAFYESTIAGELQSLKEQLDQQRKLVEDQVEALNAERRIKPRLELKATPAPRYWQPNEPVLLLSGEDFQLAVVRFGNAGKDSDGYLVCRVDNQLLDQIIVNNITITNTDFAALDLPAPNNLPQAALFDGLLQECCLLNTNIVSALSGIAARLLEDALRAALNGGLQTTYTFTGMLPAALAVRWWSGNPWTPIMVIWETGFAPVQPTQTGMDLNDYVNGFFVANYKVNQDVGGGRIEYTGPSDPREIMKYNKQSYTGSAIISPSAAISFRKQLEDYLEDHKDKTLEIILAELETGPFFSFSVSGFANALIMLDQNLQLSIKVPENNPYYFLTEAVAEIIGRFYTVSPVPNSYYNPIRAGYTDVKLTAVDVYGDKRDIKIEQLICADAMTTLYNTVKETDIIFIPPRVSQPSRLLFRWLSSTTDGTIEMDAEPAVSPVCGWILPNHLDESLFFYDQDGKALGNIYLNGNHTKIMWQPAPGNDQIIHQSVAEVFTYTNPAFKDLAVALYSGTPGFFLDFWSTIDAVHNFVNPQSAGQNNDLAVLIGRPVAVAQALLRLETEGGPALNQSWLALQKKDKYDTDNNFTAVQFPVILGDLNDINDGLIGYFKQKDGDFDFSVFYSEGAQGDHGMVKPPATNLLLTPSPRANATDPANITADALKLLILIDPRAGISATTGILPTAYLDIPANEYTDTISTLEMTFLTTPVLHGATGFNLPLPKEDAYRWSWVEEDLVEDKQEWIVIPDLAFSASEAVAAYTPQTIKEGWLKLNPMLLDFALVNAAGQPVAIPGVLNDFTLIIRNKKTVSIKFTPGELIPEGDPNTGAVFYIHFGRLIPNDKVPDLKIEATNWKFKCLNNTQYGNYWAATPAITIELPHGEQMEIKITQAMVANIGGQTQVYFDYYDITGVNDGTDECLLSLVPLTNN